MIMVCVLVTFSVFWFHLVSFGVILGIFEFVTLCHFVSFCITFGHFYAIFNHFNLTWSLFPTLSLIFSTFPHTCSRDHSESLAIGNHFVRFIPFVHAILHFSNVDTILELDNIIRNEIHVAETGT